MKIKLLEDVDGSLKDTIIDCDDAKAKELVDGKKAIEYTEEVKKVDEDLIKDKIQSEVQEASKEVKMSKLEEKKEVKVEVKGTTEWKSMGEFLDAVVKADRDGIIDGRLITKVTGQSETSNGGADGGYSVTTDLAKFITLQTQGASVLASKCSKLEIGPYFTGIKVPQWNESARNQTTLYGGVRCYAPAEGIAKTPFVAKLTQATCSLKKLCAVNYCTDELLQDNVALEGFIRMNVGKALAWTLDNDILNGTLSVCTAIKNNAATAETTFAGAYPTPTELAQMFAQNLNRTRAEWFMSGDQYAHLLALATTGTFPLFQANFAVSPAGTLFGRPINVIEQASTSSDETAFMFLDLSDYLVVTKGGVEEATSIHVKFLEDETAFRWTMRVGGMPLMASTVTLPDGVAYSSLVTRD